MALGLKLVVRLFIGKGDVEDSSVPKLLEGACRGLNREMTKDQRLKSIPVRPKPSSPRPVVIISLSSHYISPKGISPTACKR